MVLTKNQRMKWTTVLLKELIHFRHTLLISQEWATFQLFQNLQSKLKSKRWSSSMASSKLNSKSNLDRAKSTKLLRTMQMSLRLTSLKIRSLKWGRELHRKEIRFLLDKTNWLAKKSLKSKQQLRTMCISCKNLESSLSRISKRCSTTRKQKPRAEKKLATVLTQTLIVTTRQNQRRLLRREAPHARLRMPWKSTMLPRDLLQAIKLGRIRVWSRNQRRELCLAISKSSLEMPISHPKERVM